MNKRGSGCDFTDLATDIRDGARERRDDACASEHGFRFLQRRFGGLASVSTWSLCCGYTIFKGLDALPCLGCKTRPRFDLLHTRRGDGVVDRDECCSLWHVLSGRDVHRFDQPTGCRRQCRIPSSRTSPVNRQVFEHSAFQDCGFNPEPCVTTVRSASTCSDRSAAALHAPSTSVKKQITNIVPRKNPNTGTSSTAGVLISGTLTSNERKLCW